MGCKQLVVTVVVVVVVDFWRVRTQTDDKTGWSTTYFLCGARRNLVFIIALDKSALNETNMSQDQIVFEFTILDLVFVYCW